MKEKHAMLSILKSENRMTFLDFQGRTNDMGLEKNFSISIGK